MTGPAPKHPSTRARTNDKKKGFEVLPSSGRDGVAPAWPLLPNLELLARLNIARDRLESLPEEIEAAEDGRAKGRLRREQKAYEITAATLSLQLIQGEDSELSLWADLWETPQAVVWEKTHALREVAQYVRWKIQAEQGDLKAASEARQLSDRLGLNPLALMRLHIEIEHVEEVQEKGAKRRTTAKASTPQSKGDPRAVLRAV